MSKPSASRKKPATANDSAETVKKPSAAEIYQSLRDQILSFELYPGSRVTESELAAQYQVSRTPIREALQRLEMEGCLTVQPKQGVYIRNLDIVELMQYYEVRLALEIRAMEYACANIPDRPLQQLAEEWNPALPPPADLDELVARDEQFHLTLAELGGNRVLARYLRDINNHIRVVRRLDFSEASRPATTREEHHQIVLALLDRDAVRAKQALYRHIKKSEEFAKTITLTQLAYKRLNRPGGG
jgi:DNA-binding GntR family transcriptional regulator